MTQVFQAVQAIEFTAQRVKILQAGLFDARGRLAGPVYLNLERNFRRINRAAAAGEARPLEVLDLHSQSQRRAGRLRHCPDGVRAGPLPPAGGLGMPSQGIVDPRLLPLPPCCNKNKAGKQPTPTPGK